MNTPFYIVVLLAFIISTGCETKNASETKAPPAEARSAPPLAQPTVREVDRYEFVEKELVQHPEDEGSLNHNYIGSRDGFDYISVRNNRYKIPSDQLDLKHSFSLTEDTTKWIPLRIHFSQVHYNRK